MMMEGIYPGGIRENYLANVYCEMAMESYYHALLSHEIIEKFDYSWDCYREYDNIRKSVISTVVFSAMTIEAFLNDYAAACLGDEFFSKFVDKFRLIDKLEFIGTVIFKEEINKGKSYYSRLMTLFRDRNRYVHSKSKRSSIRGNTLEEMQEIEEAYTSDSYEIEAPLLDKGEIEDDMKQGIDALKTIRDMAIYLDEHDSDIYAIKKLFPSPYVHFSAVGEEKYRLPILHLLEIKVDKL